VCLCAAHENVFAYALHACVQGEWLSWVTLSHAPIKHMERLVMIAALLLLLFVMDASDVQHWINICPRVPNFKDFFPKVNLPSVVNVLSESYLIWN